MTLVVALLALLLRPVPGAAQTILSGEEDKVYDLVNATRAEHGLAPLTRSASLDDVARAQSERMVQTQDLFHNPDLAGALTATNLPWIFTGENVGVGPDISAIHEAFVASLHHYENIVKPDFDHIGVGVLSNPAGGIYVTHVFAQLNPAPTAPPAPTTAAAPSPTPRPSPVATPAAPPAPAPIAVEGGVVVPGRDFGETPQPPSPSWAERLAAFLFGR